MNTEKKKKKKKGYKGSIRDEFNAVAPAVINILSDGDDK